MLSCFLSRPAIRGSILAGMLLLLCFLGGCASRTPENSGVITENGNATSGGQMASGTAHTLTAVPGTAVKRRQLVIVDTEGKGWRLQTKARAHEGGTVGDIITVEDLETKAKYPVRITGMGTVSVVVNKNKLIYNRE